MVDIMFQLAGAGQSKYPCVRCLWRNRLTNKEINEGITPYTSAPLRKGFDQWKEFLSWVPEGGKGGRNNFGVRGLPVSEYVTNHIGRIVMPPELHVHLGIINTCVIPRIEQKLGKEKIAEWELEAGTCKKEYFEGQYNGNGCSKLAAKCECLKTDAPEIYDVLQKYKKLKKHVFKKRNNLTLDDVEKCRETIKNFMEAWKEAELRVTHKLHWMKEHAMSVIEHERRTLAFYAGLYIFDA